MRVLSKSKIISMRQCPKRLWLEIYHPEHKQDSPQTEAKFNIGHAIGDIARHIYDPQNSGNTIDIHAIGFDQAFVRTKELLEQDHPIFEAGFKAAGGLAFADVLLPDHKLGSRVWRMVEVKSSTSVKDYHLDDITVQTYIAKEAGVPLASVALAYIDSQWVYQGDGNYAGLLVEEDLTEETLMRLEEAKKWISEAQEILKLESEPPVDTGAQCTSPYECGFIDYCKSKEPYPAQPISILPRIQTKSLKDFVKSNRYASIQEVPDDLLNELQARVKECTIQNKIFFDPKKAKKELSKLTFPLYFMDFETNQMAIPIWRGTRPYQQIPFQFSIHKLSNDGELSHLDFLDLSGDDPSYAFVKSLIESIGSKGSILVYNASFENTRLRELANRFPDLQQEIDKIIERTFDLLPVTQNCYYHPDQLGSWSIKAVLPTISTDLNYAALEGIKDGGMAMDAYAEAISPNTKHDRKQQIQEQLIQYCGLDTLAMVKLWEFLTSGQTDAQAS